MMAQGSYDSFCEDVLIACAASSREHPNRAVLIDALCRENGWDIPQSWRQNVVTTLVDRGYGSDWSTFGDKSFFIRGEGILAAEEFQRQRAPKNVGQRIKSVPRSDWIALLALVTSIIALFKGD